jgi:uncharacterized protein (DUF58 family)
MAWRSGPAVPLKRERAELLLLATASLLLRGGERVRLVGSGASGRNHAGRAGLQAVADALNRATPPPPRPDADAAGGEPGVPPFDPTLPRHARAVLFGDFLSPLEDIRRSVSALASLPLRGHLVQILDPAEETLPFDGRVEFEGLEGEDELLIPRVEAVRQAYMERLEAHRDGLAALARAAGWSFVTHRTDRPPQTALLALYGAIAQEPTS